MFISKIHIKNFRNFKDNEVQFNDGINVIIGHNNAGKSNLLRALGLVLNQKSQKRLTINDFNMKSTLDELKQQSPRILIEVTIFKGKTSTEDDLVTVSEWLTKLDENYEAKLTYEFFLPEKYEEKYLNTIREWVNPNEGQSEQELKNKIFKLIDSEFLRYYTYKIWGGEVANHNQADGDLLQKFDFQFLDAIRDVERDLISGRNVMLKKVLNFFLDYEIKSSNAQALDKESAIKEKRDEFSGKSAELIKVLDKRIEKGKQQILNYATSTGASLKSTPNFEGETSDVEMLSFLRLIVEEAGFKIPASHNGLGYNNLIYISILLAQMQADADEDYLGSNSKIFPMLVIEEPEAHLHPSMQDKFLKFLRDNISNDRVRQIFITSHSTHVTSATELDEIICLHHDLNGNTNVGYLGKVFDDSDEDVKSKKYVKRFLDATKSNMLFAEKIILVEGLAEQLLINVFATILKIPLEDHHISVINVGGRHFNHFLKLFDTEQSKQAVFKKVACITDRDPSRKDISKNTDKYEKCYPFEYGVDSSNYKYKDHATFLIEKYQNHTNIKFFSQDRDKGKTFEYDLVLNNPTCKLLITDSMSNKDEIRRMMDLNQENPLSDYLDLLVNGKKISKESERIKQSIEGLNNEWSEEDKKHAVIASRYLNSIGKGENALELACALEDNLINETEEFIVPEYIEEAIKWIIE